MNVSSILTKNYENKSNWTLGENKPNSKPIKPNFRKSPNECKLIYNEGLQKKRRFRSPKNKPNSNPIQTQSNPISDYPCVFELAVYNLVLHNDNVMHSMPNGRIFDGENMKWQMHRKQMR
jgi:hypothetical protein